MIRNEVNVNEVVKQEYITPVSLYDGVYTKTTQFLLPAIALNVKNRLIHSFFVNSYVGDKGHRNNYDRPIFVLFAVKDFASREWHKVYSTLVKSENYVDDYDCGKQDDKNLVMMVFRVPEEFEEDYYHFKRGRYSKFSKEYKSKFPQYVHNENGEKVESMIWQVIHKSATLKRKLEDEFGLDYGQLDKDDTAEIWDLPRRNREYYRYEETLS